MNSQNIQHVNYYAVFDGHNGSGAASYSSAHLHQFLVESQFYPMYPEQALSDAFKITDRHLLAKDDAQVQPNSLSMREITDEVTSNITREKMNNVMR